MNEAAVPNTRKVLLRSAMVMSPDPGGVFDTLLRLVRWGLGGRSGDGRQYVSWVHEQDFVRAVDWLIQHDELDGPVNLAAPHPLPNAEFMQTLRRAWGISFGLPAAEWMLEIGAFLLRTETELILKSRRVVPGRLTNAGFEFDFPNWEQAAADLCERWRELRRNAWGAGLPRDREEAAPTSSEVERGRICRSSTRRPFARAAAYLEHQTGTNDRAVDRKAKWRS